MQLIGISHCGPDLVDGVMCELKELRGFDHAVVDQKFLGGFPDGFFEYFAEIAAVEVGALRDVLHGDIVHVIVFDVGERFFDIVVFYFTGGRTVFLDGSCQCVNENVEVPDQMKGCLFFVAHNIEHFVAHLFFKFMVDRYVNRVVDGKSGDLKRFFGS